MIERQLWHPVADAHALRDAPMAIHLMGEPLVLWRDHASVHAWVDRCPHRGARLSLGRVLTTTHGLRLECPYHGWQFEGGGRCQHVPASPDFHPPSGHAATVVEAIELHGLIWVRLQPWAGLPPGVPLDAPPAFAEADDPAWRRVICGPYSVATSAPRLVENFLDLSHFGFVHEGWLGERGHAQVQTGEVSEGPLGVRVSAARAWQPRAYANADGGAWIDYGYTVPHPYAAVLRKDASEGDPVRNAIALFIRPDGDEACTAWFVMATHNDPASSASVVEFQDTVFAQDRPVVESQQPKVLPIGRMGPVREVHGPADRVSSAYRRYLHRLGITLGTC
ncbi:MAG: aromatic ring-hydroxylating dioxygenase subunit alpha [Hydrogenophaga sp.]|uniref:aromatic ring-hydroxylating oxygenase subunit alpha n=1 Tax=Hydrogenophaga sp. TaxID=1904254 RepID=UPI001DA544EE|nr:aromatic ring-hydroxylating dioxygenase subunit alpha [Hydrogenophaga sp.]MBX3608510.1 aromatic ring-hydroxylating dioxygenase subunit alpha [Hydrogenophaga sp.]